MNYIETLIKKYYNLIVLLVSNAKAVPLLLPIIAVIG